MKLYMKSYQEIILLQTKKNKKNNYLKKIDNFFF
jgi:hypothetical protein